MDVESSLSISFQNIRGIRTKNKRGSLIESNKLSGTDWRAAEI